MSSPFMYWISHSNVSSVLHSNMFALHMTIGKCDRWVNGIKSNEYMKIDQVVALHVHEGVF